MTTLHNEEAWLYQLQQSRMIGIAFLDAEGRLVERIDDDPAVREAVIECQAERVRQLRLSDGTATGAGNGAPSAYPNLED